MNLLYYGDNFDVLQRHVADAFVDLVYLSPPFNSNANYNVLFAEHGTKAAAQIQAFEDTWTWDENAARSYEYVVEQGGHVSQAMQAFRTFLGENDMLAYLAMMAPRLIELRARRPAHRVPERPATVRSVLAAGGSQRRRRGAVDASTTRVRRRSRPTDRRSCSWRTRRPRPDCSSERRASGRRAPSAASVRRRSTRAARRSAAETCPRTLRCVRSRSRRTRAASPLATPCRSSRPHSSSATPVRIRPSTSTSWTDAPRRIEIVQHWGRELTRLVPVD